MKYDSPLYRFLALFIVLSFLCPQPLAALRQAEPAESRVRIGLEQQLRSPVFLDAAASSTGLEENWAHAFLRTPISERLSHWADRFLTMVNVDKPAFFRALFAIHPDLTRDFWTAVLTHESGGGASMRTWLYALLDTNAFDNNGVYGLIETLSQLPGEVLNVAVASEEPSSYALGVLLTAFAESNQRLAETRVREMSGASVGYMYEQLARSYQTKIDLVGETSDLGELFLAMRDLAHETGLVITRGAAAFPDESVRRLDEGATRFYPWALERLNRVIEQSGSDEPYIALFALNEITRLMRLNRDLRNALPGGDSGLRLGLDALDYDERRRDIVARIRAGLALSADGRTRIESEAAVEIAAPATLQHLDEIALGMGGRFQFAHWVDNSALLTGTTRRSMTLWSGGSSDDWKSSRDWDYAALEHDPSVLFYDHASALYVSGHRDGVIRFWSASGMRRLAYVQAHDTAINHIAVDSARGTLLTTSHDEIHLWDLQRRDAEQGGLPASIAVEQLPGSVVAEPVAHPDGGFVLALSDGHVYRLQVRESVASAESIWVRLLNTAQTSEPQIVYEPVLTRIQLPEAARGHILAVGPSMSWVALATRRGLRIFGVSGEDLTLFEDQQVTALQRSPAGDLWVGFSDGRVVALDGETFAPLYEGQAGSYDILDMQFSPDGTRLLVVNAGHRASIWDSRAFAPDNVRVTEVIVPAPSDRIVPMPGATLMPGMFQDDGDDVESADAALDPMTRGVHVEVVQTETSPRGFFWEEPVDFGAAPEIDVTATLLPGQFPAASSESDAAGAPNAGASDTSLPEVLERTDAKPAEDAAAEQQARDTATLTASLDVSEAGEPAADETVVESSAPALTEFVPDAGVPTFLDVPRERSLGAGISLPTQLGSPTFDMDAVIATTSRQLPLLANASLEGFARADVKEASELRLGGEVLFSDAEGSFFASYRGDELLKTFQNVPGVTNRHVVLYAAIWKVLQDYVSLPEIRLVNFQGGLAIAITTTGRTAFGELLEMSLGAPPKDILAKTREHARRAARAHRDRISEVLGQFSQGWEGQASIKQLMVSRVDRIRFIRKSGLPDGFEGFWDLAPISMQSLVETDWTVHSEAHAWDTFWREVADLEAALQADIQRVDLSGGARPLDLLENAAALEPATGLEENEDAEEPTERQSPSQPQTVSLPLNPTMAAFINVVVIGIEQRLGINLLDDTRPWGDAIEASEFGGVWFSNEDLNISLGRLSDQEQLGFQVTARIPSGKWDTDWMATQLGILDVFRLPSETMTVRDGKVLGFDAPEAASTYVFAEARNLADELRLVVDNPPLGMLQRIGVAVQRDQENHLYISYSAQRLLDLFQGMPAFLNVAVQALEDPRRLSVSDVNVPMHLGWFRESLDMAYDQANQRLYTSSNADLLEIDAASGKVERVIQGFLEELVWYRMHFDAASQSLFVAGVATPAGAAGTLENRLYRVGFGNDDPEFDVLWTEPIADHADWVRDLVYDRAQEEIILLTGAGLHYITITGGVSDGPQFSSVMDRIAIALDPETNRLFVLEQDRTETGATADTITIYDKTTLLSDEHFSVDPTSGSLDFNPKTETFLVATQHGPHVLPLATKQTEALDAFAYYPTQSVAWDSERGIGFVSDPFVGLGYVTNNQTARIRAFSLAARAPTFVASGVNRRRPGTEEILVLADKADAIAALSPKRVFIDFDKTIWGGFPHEAEGRFFLQLLGHDPDVAVDELRLYEELVGVPAKGKGFEEHMAMVRDAIAAGRPWTIPETIRVGGTLVPFTQANYVAAFNEHVIDPGIDNQGWADPSTLVPGVETFLRRLRLERDVLTGGDAPTRTRIAEKLGVLGLLGRIFGDGEKDRRIREISADKTLAPNESLIIGDGPGDVEAGNKAGIVTVAVAQTQEEWDAFVAAKGVHRPHVIIKDFTQLAQLAEVLKLPIEGLEEILILPDKREALDRLQPRHLLIDFDETVWGDYPRDFSARIYAEILGVKMDDEAEMGLFMERINRERQGLGLEGSNALVQAVAAELNKPWLVPAQIRVDSTLVDFDQTNYSAFVAERLFPYLEERGLATRDSVVPGVREFLERLNLENLPDVITGAGGPGRERVAKMMEVRDLLGRFFGGGKKTQRVADLMEAESYAPHELIVIGDGSADIQAGNKNGVVTVAVARERDAWDRFAAESGDRRPHVIIKDFTQLEQLAEILKLPMHGLEEGNAEATAHVVDAGIGYLSTRMQVSTPFGVVAERFQQAAALIDRGIAPSRIFALVGGREEEELLIAMGVPADQVLQESAYASRASAIQAIWQLAVRFFRSAGELPEILRTTARTLQGLLAQLDELLPAGWYTDAPDSDTLEQMKFLYQLGL